MRTSRRRPGRAAAIGALALGAALLLAGCGAATSGAAGSSPTPSGGTVDPAPLTSLTVVVHDGHGSTQTWTLHCDPPGGDHPDPAAACAALERGGERFLPPVRPDMACTQIYGGPETATVTGTWRGEQVTASFSRTDGCQIARWNGLEGLLPQGGL
jgi:hypothetical protein